MPGSEQRDPGLDRDPARRAALAAFGCLAGTALTAAHAEEPDFGVLFSPAPPPTQQAATVQAQAPSAPAPESYAQRRRQRAETNRVRPRIRNAALPNEESLKLRVSDRPTPLNMKAGPVAAFLRDDTLKPGDIVVLKGCARVFTGQPGRKHSLRDFEPAQASGLLDKRTRVQLDAMIRPSGARPSDGTRSMKARLRSVPTTVAASANPQKESAAVRVIYRTNFTR